MPTLTPQGEEAVNDVSRRFQLSRDSVIHLLEALRRGRGTMAQFQCVEFGSGQWMQGGMTMVGDMFNHSLKARVNEVFNELANAMSRDELFTKEPECPGGTWWPGELGSPVSTGSQNQMRYAVFPGTRRLAVERQGEVTVYDTGKHQIGGVSQQQGASSSVVFSSQLGSFPADSLPVVSGKKEEQSNIPGKAESPPSAPLPASPQAKTDAPSDVAATLRKLAELHAEGLLTDEEFAAKRKQVIDRI
jgi:hypothetical protein